MPAGAVVTGVRGRYYDYSDENVDFFFFLDRVHNRTGDTDRMARGEEVHSEYFYSEDIQLVDDTDSQISYDTISDSYSYFVYIDWRPTGTITTDRLRFYGITITYVVDEAD